MQGGFENKHWSSKTVFFLQLDRASVDNVSKVILVFKAASTEASG